MVTELALSAILTINPCIGMVVKAYQINQERIMGVKLSEAMDKYAKTPTEQLMVIDAYAVKMSNKRFTIRWADICQKVIKTDKSMK